MKKRSVLSLSALAVALAAPASAERVVATVVGHKEGLARLVRVETVAEGVYRVTSTPENRFRDRESLVVKKGGSVSAASDGASSFKVDPATGRVSFFRGGVSVLSEKAVEFTPIEADGVKGYTTLLRFHGDPDESFYGLGQHQTGNLDMRGLSEDLYQYNTKISVPFVWSTKGYGVYVDTYSHARWGNPEPEKELSEVFDFAALPTAGRDGERTVFGWALLPRVSGPHEFSLYYSGYTRLFVDGEEAVSERWRQAWNPNTCKFTLDLEKGKEIKISVEWRPDGAKSYCSLHAREPNKYAGEHVWWSEMTPELDYYVMIGETPGEVVAKFRALTGGSPMMPKWAMGYWQSREKYTTQEEVVGTVREFRKRGVPLDNIVQDWFYWREDDWGSHAFDPARYPDPKAMLDDLHALDARFMISVWPKFYPMTENYRALDANGWMFTRPIADGLRDWVGNGGYPYSFYDAWSEGARRMFWDQINTNLFCLGVDAWWMDASEPNVRDCIPLDMQKKYLAPVGLGSSTEYLNTYALVNAQAIWEGQRAAAPDQRVFMLTRSGFAGMQRYSAASWSGDIGTRWEDMRGQLTAGLGYASCALPWWTMDIGGFSVEDRYIAAQDEFDRSGKENEDLKEWRELNVRWFEFGAFVPLMRAHGQYPYREPWNIAPKGHPAYDAVVDFIGLRYRLLPYVYAMADMVSHEGYTIMRPLAMDWPAEKDLRDVRDEYMFGPAFLVAPVMEYGRREREVVLPPGEWYDFWSGKKVLLKAGDRKLVAPAPLERMPLFVRAGAIVPMGPVRQWTGDAPGAPLEIRVYAGADGEFELYDDDGVSFACERGEFERIPLVWNDGKRTLSVGGREGKVFAGMPEGRELAVTVTDAYGTTTKRVRYSGARLDVSVPASRNGRE